MQGGGRPIEDGQPRLNQPPLRPAPPALKLRVAAFGVRTTTPRHAAPRRATPETYHTGHEYSHRSHTFPAGQSLYIA